MAACLTFSTGGRGPWEALDRRPRQAWAAASVLPNEGLPLGALVGGRGVGISFPARQWAAVISTSDVMGR